ncbi:MAG: AAA family ATPase [Bacilli bacterium]|nr:AAA family ATPase [Bacilli bacterium]
MLSICLIGVKGVDNMINIERINIKGFRNIENIELKLGKITSLLSINSFGKSNLLNGMHFGIDFINKQEKVRSNMMRWKSGLPLNKNIKDKTFLFEMEFTTKFEKDIYKIIYSYSFNWVSSEKQEGRIMSEYLNVKNLNESQKYTNFIKREKKDAYYKTSIKGSCDKKIKIGDKELIINKLNAYDDLFYHRLIKTINNINIYIDRHFDSNKNFDIEPFILKEGFKDTILGDDNVPRILYNIKEEHPDKFELIINTFKDLFPFISDIEVKSIDIEPDKLMDGKLDGSEPFRITDRIYLVFVKDKNLLRKIPFDLMSDGAKRVLSIFTYLTLAELKNYSLVAIEEPENSVHPRLMQQYLIALDSFIGNSKLIITSHSPHLINYINPNDIYLGIPNNEGLAKFCKIKDSSITKVMKDASEFNVLSGDYLFDLMSGTEEDIEVLTSYVE